MVTNNKDKYQALASIFFTYSVWLQTKYKLAVLKGRFCFVLTAKLTVIYFF